MSDTVPAEVVAAALGRPGVTPVTVRRHPVTTSMGAVTAGVTRVTGTARDGTEELPFSVIHKTVTPVTSGRHAKAAADPRHWAYWRREPLAYRGAVLPRAKSFRAPHCYGADDADIYLEDVGDAAENPAVAARRLGRWQAATPIPRHAWIGGHQLAQRIAVTRLDWTGFDVDERLRELWERRDALMARLAEVPEVLSHGDFGIHNFVSAGRTTVVFDWSNLGVAPLGADLAHLALSTGEAHIAEYRDGLGAGFDAEAVRLGFRVTLALTAASRAHWMATRGKAFPGAITELVAEGCGSW